MFLDWLFGNSGEGGESDENHANHLVQLYSAVILLALIILPNFCLFGRTHDPEGGGYVSGSYTKRIRAEAAAVRKAAAVAGGGGDKIE
jgi:hypothetical protein